MSDKLCGECGASRGHNSQVGCGGCLYFRAEHAEHLFLFVKDHIRLLKKDWNHVDSAVQVLEALEEFIVHCEQEAR